ncbi:hypothetical protein B0T10DRAFT_465601 [Thelonectria olida]|uniref:TNFR-Cys domain-containing protein n=1 Tax=Thelonectria olida TaxID=1576542 RepID=A0A9P9AJH1_9HYPO|nr:hypothetical protein B0T10DRAFT_465601 [Thelonectria olida]
MKVSAKMIVFNLLLLTTGISAHLANRQGNSECAHWCADNFPTPGADCTSLAAKGEGPCYECGPAAPHHNKILCNGACVPIDNNNCGRCGKKCTGGSSCVGGNCKCPADKPKLCNGMCTNTNTDSNNCGHCGRKCTGGSSCVGGNCKCPTDKPDRCDGTCTNKNTDNNNCGRCGKKCTGGSSCVGGNCKCPADKPDRCDGTCTNKNTDNNNCGRCGKKIGYHPLGATLLIDWLEVYRRIFMRWRLLQTLIAVTVDPVDTSGVCKDDVCYITFSFLLMLCFLLVSMAKNKLEKDISQKCLLISEKVLNIIMGRIIMKLNITDEVLEGNCLS